MSEQIRAFVSRISSPLGEITISADGDALTGLWMEGQRFFARTLPEHCEERRIPVLEAAQAWLERYFSGMEPGPCPPLRPAGSVFQKLVWDCLRAVPYGQTRTYGEIAQQIARITGAARVSARAVGAAAARNPVALMIPCHRILGADGKLTGYAGGLERKRLLLELEKAGLSAARNVSFVQISDPACFHA